VPKLDTWVSVFGFRFTIQNITNRHVSNAFGLIAVLSRFPGALLLLLLRIYAAAAARPHPTPPPLFWGKEVPKK
jgi:hypothetical protein